MKNIKIHIPGRFTAERKYVIEFIFKDILKVDFEVISESRKNYMIDLPNGKHLILADQFFNPDEDPFTLENIPSDVTFVFKTR